MLAFLRRQDWFLNVTVLFLALCSLLILSSINTGLFIQQLIWFGIGALVIVLFTAIDWRPLTNYRWAILFIYLFSILLLVITYFVAPPIRHTRS